MPDSAADPPPSQQPSNPDPAMPPRKSHAGGKLRKPISTKFRAAAEQRLAHLQSHLRLHPSPPLSFSSSPHEAALRSLGLLDFARLDLQPGSARPDLVARLIAYYDPPNHRSFVHGVRLSVGRTDLARALFLPPKPTSTAPPPDVDPPAVVSAVLEFMKVYILPPFQGDDMCILPQEVGAAEQAVKEGSAHRVDWAGLIWGLVEKEIFEMPTRDERVCYYGPYLQRLILVQKPKLFEPVEEEEREEVALEVSVDADVDEEDGDADVMSKGVQELDSADVDADVRSNILDESETQDVHSRSSNLEELEAGNVEARIKSIEEVELSDRDNSDDARNRRLETLKVAGEESSGTTLDESKTTDKLGPGFAAVEAVAVRHETMTSNVEDLAEVAQEGDEYTPSVGVADTDTCPLVTTILVTHEQILAIPGETEDADGEDEKDTTGLSMGVCSDGEETKDTTGLNLGISSDEEEEKEDTTRLSLGISSDSDGEEEKGITGLNLGVISDEEEERDTAMLSLGVSSDGEEEKDTTELSLGISSDGEEEQVATGLSLGISSEGEEEEEKDTTGLSLGISSANDCDSMDVEDNASVENLDEGDSGKEGADVSDDDAFEECRDGVEMNWRTGDEKGDEETTHCLQQCNSSAFAGMEFENLNKGDVGMRDEMSFDDGFPGKMVSMHGMESTNLLEAMNSIPAAYNGSENAHDLSSGDFLAIGADAQKDEIDLGTGSSFFFGNNGKRHIGDIDEYNMQAQGQFPPVNQQKRMRSDNNSSTSPGSAVFNANFTEPIQNLLVKASMFYQQKERELEAVLVDKQNLSNLLHEKEAYIQLLNSARFEQESKWQAELRRFEHDLNVMGQLVSGYKKALKQNRAAFDEYRRKYPCEKPRYVDVPGGGGLVLGVKELEIKRLEEEQQKLAVANDMIEKFQHEWFLKADEWRQQITSMWSRMEGLAREIDLLKERRKTEVSAPATEE